MTATETTEAFIASAEAHSAHNYHPLPVVVATADGAWMTDVEGRRFLDLLAGYSALNFGHGNRRLIDAAKAQLERVTLTSRAFHHDRFADFCRELASLCGKDMVLPMNTGAEAVETAVKTARKWGYRVKGVPDGRARIVVASDNFHGRTTTIISFSTDPEARADFGPYTPGFDIVPYGDLAAVREAVTEETVAVLLEPIQGEAGVLVPPPGYLAGVRELTRERNVLFIADEIQSGLGRTGKTFACEHEGVVPDVYVLGKALGGGVVPVSAVVADRDVLGVFRPGEHGSTFGGNPLACAVALEVIAMLRSGAYQRRARSSASICTTSWVCWQPRAMSRRCAGAGCGRASTSLRRTARAGDLREADGPGRPRQGHPRCHGPDRPAPGHQQGGPGLGAGPTPRRTGGVGNAEPGG